MDAPEYSGLIAHTIFESQGRRSKFVMCQQHPWGVRFTVCFISKVKRTLFYTITDVDKKQVCIGAQLLQDELIYLILLEITTCSKVLQ